MAKEEIMKKAAFFIFAVAITLTALTAVTVTAGEVRYKADVYCNFKFDRTVEIIFDPAVGAQKAWVFYGEPRLARVPGSPPGGEWVDMKKLDDNRWVFRRNGAMKDTTIIKDAGRLIIRYFGSGNYAEGELRLDPAGK